MSYSSVPNIEPRSPQGDFVNEPFENFSLPQTARAMESALAAVRSQLGREYDLIIGGHRIRTVGKIRSINPARPAEVVGIHQKAELEHAQLAMDAALKAFESWSRVPVAVRASLLFRAAEIIRERKFEFCAWLTFEVGKNWAESDADVGETIDFLNIIVPAPKNPIPTTICEAIRIGSKPPILAYLFTIISEIIIKRAEPIETSACVFIPASLCTKKRSAPTSIPKITAKDNLITISLFCIINCCIIWILYNNPSSKTNVFVINNTRLTRSN